MVGMSAQGSEGQAGSGGWNSQQPLMAVAIIEDRQVSPSRWVRFELNDFAFAAYKPLAEGEVHHWPRPSDPTTVAAFPVGTLLEWWHDTTLGWAVVTVNDESGIDATLAPPPFEIATVGLEDMTILPPDPAACQTCAVRHDPTQPHDACSLHYQYVFRQQTGRWPSWADAANHCTPTIQAQWRETLERDHGVTWNDPTTVHGHQPTVQDS